MMIRADKAFVGIIMLDTDVQKILERLIAKVENDSVKTKEMCSRMMQHKSTKKSTMEVMKDKSCQSLKREQTQKSMRTIIEDLILIKYRFDECHVDHSWI